MSQLLCMTLRRIGGKTLSKTDYLKNKKVCDSYGDKESECLRDKNCLWEDKRKYELYNLPWIKSITHEKNIRHPEKPMDQDEAKNLLKEMTTIPKNWNSFDAKTSTPTVITVKANSGITYRLQCLNMRNLIITPSVKTCRY